MVRLGGRQLGSRSPRRGNRSAGGPYIHSRELRPDLAVSGAATESRGAVNCGLLTSGIAPRSLWCRQLTKRVSRGLQAEVGQSSQALLADGLGGEKRDDGDPVGR